MRLSISGNPTDLIARDVGTETTAIDVPKFFLEPFATDDGLALVPFVFNITQEKLHLQGRWQQASYSFEVAVALYPRRLGSITVTSTVPKADWIAVKVDRAVLTSGDHKGGAYIRVGVSASHICDARGTTLLLCLWPVKS